MAKTSKVNICLIIDHLLEMSRRHYWAAQRGYVCISNKKLHRTCSEILILLQHILCCSNCYIYFVYYVSKLTNLNSFRNTIYYVSMASLCEYLHNFTRFDKTNWVSFKGASGRHTGFLWSLWNTDDASYYYLHTSLTMDLMFRFQVRLIIS
jgi:hypothetical protein